MREPWSRALDTARGWGAVFVVVTHGAIPYAAHEFPSLRWHVREPPGSPAFDVTFWWCCAFITPLFALVGGFFAAGSCEAHGPAVLARSRLKRLGVPLLVGTALVLPLTYFSWLPAWQKRGLADPAHLFRGNFTPGLERALWGFGHLWFLQHLLLLTLSLALWRWLARRAHTLPGSTPGSPPAAGWLPALAAGALAGGLVVALAPGVLLDFRNEFIPDPFKLAYHAVFFVAGVRLWPHRNRLLDWTRSWWLELVLAAAAMAWLTRFIADPRGGSEPFLAAVASVVTWCSIVAFLGLAARAGSLALWRRLTDASFTMYIVHLPILAAVQLALMDTPLPRWLKFALGVTTTIAACLGLHALLRRLRFGWVLGA